LPVNRWLKTKERQGYLTATGFRLASATRPLAP
jgi:hypothetical protein